MSDVRLSLPPALERAVRVRLARFESEGFASRLDRHDSTLWSADPAHRKVAAERLGWLDSPATMRAQTGAFRDFVADVRAEGFTRALLLGMGGSSLAPEVLRRSLGVALGFLDLEVLDNTSPAAVRAALERSDARRTLVLVSSKSGSTVEVTSFERVAWSWVESARGAEAGRSFVAITDPSTSLERLARERGYRRVFTNPADIGGRYSALSCFGLVPAALLGADVDALLDAALDEMRATAGDVPAERNPALILGAALGEAAQSGRDKVTLLLSSPLEALGDWIEQLLAESTGKDGRGLVPIVNEAPLPPEAYGADRLFVTIDSGATERSRIDALRAAGHPVLEWSRRDAVGLGAEFLRWEKATAAAAVVLGVDPFDEPNVAEAKQATRSLLDRYLAEGDLPRPRTLASAGGVEVMAPPAVADALRPRVAEATDPLAWAAALGGLAGAGDYVAVLAYLHAPAERRARLERVRTMTGAPAGLATTLGIGPRFLHSTGQLHKGGPDRGIFLQLVGAEGDLAIPGERYGFRILQQSQALGDYQVLERRGRRVLRLDLGTEIDRGLDALAEALSAARRA